MSIDRWHTLTVFPWLETVLKNRTQYAFMSVFFLGWRFAIRRPIAAHTGALKRRRLAIMVPSSNCCFKNLHRML
jgi:hypothetical protein